MNPYSGLKKKLHGPIFSIITPFNSKEQIDKLSLKKYINYLFRRGAKIFYLMVYNSRLGLLSEKEILDLHSFCINEIKRLDNKNIVIAAEPYHTSTAQTLLFIKKFSAMKADIVSVIFGEKFYSDDQLLNHFKFINNKSPIPLLLHQQILENGLSSNPPFVYYPLQVLKKISTLSKFIAMKEDAKNDLYTKKISLSMSNHITIITSGSGKRQWIKANKYGAQSWLSGISNLDPLIGIDFWNYFKDGNLEQLNLIINKLEDPFFRVKKKYGWHLTIKSCLEHFKLMKRYERMPLKEITKLQHNDIKKLYNLLTKNNKKFFNGRYFK